MFQMFHIGSCTVPGACFALPHVSGGVPLLFILLRIMAQHGQATQRSPAIVHLDEGAPH